MVTNYTQTYNRMPPYIREALILGKLMIEKYYGISPLGSYSYLSGTEGSLELKNISNKLVKSKRGIVMDLETTGLDPLRSSIVLVSFTYDGLHAYVFNPQYVDITPFLEVLRECPYTNHNCKFDYKFIKHEYNIEMKIDWDIYMTHAIATAGLATLIGGNSLENLAKRYLNVQLAKELRKDFLTDAWKTDDHIMYSAMDSLATYQLVPVTKTMLEASGCSHVWENIEKPLIEVIADMELRGVNVDIDTVLKMRDEYQVKLNEIEENISKLTLHVTSKQVSCPVCLNRGKKKLSCGNCNGTGKVDITVEESINPSSPKQIIDFFKKEGVPLPTKERTNGQTTDSVDKKSLSKIKHPLAALLEEHRNYAKALSSFLIPWSTPCDVNPDGKYNPDTKSIHAEITQVETETGRTSMKSPK